MGSSIGTVVVGVLGVLTLSIAALSLYSLYAATGGGVFWRGFFTLISGSVLAVALIVRSLIRGGGHRGIRHRIDSVIE